MDEQQEVKRVQAIIICIVVGLLIVSCICAYIFKFREMWKASEGPVIQLKDKEAIEFEEVEVDPNAVVDTTVVENTITPTPTPTPTTTPEPTEVPVVEEETMLEPMEETEVQEEPAEEAVEHTEEYVEDEQQPTEIEATEEITDDAGVVQEDIVMDIPVEQTGEIVE